MNVRKTAAAAQHPADILDTEHTTVMALFKRLEGTDNGREKRALAQEIFVLMEVHTKLEEEVFYPSMKRRSDGEELTQLLHEGVEEHHMANGLVQELKAMSTTDERYEAKFKVLREAVKHHMEEQRKKTFPRAKRALGEAGTELGAKMMKRREELLPPEHRTKKAA